MKTTKMNDRNFEIHQMKYQKGTRQAVIHAKEKHLEVLYPCLMISLIAGASILLYLPVFHWLLKKMTLANGYLHGFALVTIPAVALYRLAQLKTHVLRLPVFYHPGLFIWIPAAILYLFNESHIGFHTLSASLFIAYLYGLAGHFISLRQWHSMLLPLLLMILVLPFEHYLDIYLGFPLRLLSAHWAGSLMQFIEFPMLTLESILIIDNRAAIVDLDCSGIKSLWVGLIFYLLLTWIERHRVNLRWVSIGMIFLGLLVLANVFRIIILVLLELVVELPELAQLFHQALGLLGFVISCLFTWLLLHRFAHKSTNRVGSNLQAKVPQRNSKGVLPAVLILFLVTLFIFSYQPLQTTTILTPAHHSIQLPSAYRLQVVALSQEENDFFGNNQTKAEKYQLNIPLDKGKRTLDASMVLVWSRAWKTQHVPDNCYLSQGYSILDKGVWTSDQHHPLRYLHLTPQRVSSQSSKTQTAVYWFQSADSTTPDYSSRIIDNFFHPGREWVMVSFLCKETVTPEEIKIVVTILKDELSKQLKTTSPSPLSGRKHI